MSGICGVVTRGSLLASSDVIAAMCASIKPRGPDGGASYADVTGVALGQVHLDALSPAKGAPPAFIARADLVLAVDGFVLNRDEILRERPGPEGPPVNRDALALAEAYRAHGREGLAAHTTGPFTFALWDRHTRDLLLARDRMGEKSVYYYTAPDGGSIVFGSEIKAILAHPAVRPEIDMAALALHFAFGYVPGRRTLFRNIAKLLPGEWLRFGADDGVPVLERFWRYPKLGVDGPPDEATSLRVVRERTLAGMANYTSGCDEIGVFLSGGMDSSLIVGALREIGVPRIRTFSIGFEVASNNPQQGDDLRYARIVADRFATDHSELIVRGDERFARRLPEILGHFDDLVMTPNTYTKCALAEMARDAGVNAVFTGNGSTSIPFVSPRARAKFDAKVAGASTDAERYYRFRSRLFSLEAQSRLLRDGPAVDEEQIVGILEEMMREVDCDDFVRKFLFTNAQVTRTEKTIKGYERAGARAGVEVLAPFLDRGVVDLSTRLPQTFDGVNPVSLKQQLKKAFADVVPQEVQDRKVIGYPSYYWTNGELDGFQRRLFSREMVEQNGIFDHSEVWRILDADRISAKKSAGKRTWALTQFALWYEIHINRNPAYLVETQ